MKQETPKMFNEQTCKKCGYQWFARTAEPRQCPNCKRQIKYLKVKEVNKGQSEKIKVNIKP